MNYLTSMFGLSFALPDLYTQLSAAGWQIKKVKYDKQRGMFVASGVASHGEELDGWGPNEGQAVSNLLLNAIHRNGLRERVASWSYTFTDKLGTIAEAYAKAPVYEPKAAIAFMELGRDAETRAKAIGEQLDILVTNNPEPYHQADKMCDDIRKRRKLEVSRAGIDHPLWSTSQVIAFRIAFDVLGYCAAGVKDWGWEGTNQAFATYAHHISVLAQQALFSEVIGQTAYAAYYRAYGPTKIALFPEFMDPAQQQENPHDNYRGMHPTNMLLPTEMPGVKPSLSKVAAAPIPTREDGTPYVDINAGYQSPYAGNPVINYDMDHDRDQLGIDQLYQHADNLNTGWGDSFRNTGNVGGEWARVKQEDPAQAQQIYAAVSNAIRAACLSPRTKLHHNAQQYQDLAAQNVAYNETDPNVYWAALENSRQDWNAARFGDQARDEHRPWFRPTKGQNGKPEPAMVDKLAAILYQRNPEQGQAAAKQDALRHIFEWKATIQEKLTKENEKQFAEGEGEDEVMWLLDNESNKRIMKMLQRITAPSSAKHDEWMPSRDEQMSLLGARERSIVRDMNDYDQTYEGYDNHKVFNLQRYGAFMGTQCQAIARMTQHLDDIVVAALQDVHEHNGSGHHFRAFIMSLNLRGIGPKQVSFMWLLLQPLTSQLATIDVHMTKMLGYSEDDLTPRDYFRMERELQTRRDAMGLDHVPLGLFQWATWDLQRSGQRGQPQQLSILGDTPPMDVHQDHSALRVLNPTKPWQSRWIPPPPKERPYQFDFMSATDPAAKDVSEDWDKTVAQDFMKDEDYPYQDQWPSTLPYPKVAASYLSPWFIHPQTGQRIPGQPGQTLMAHLLASGLTMQQAWQLEDESVGKGPGVLS